MSAEVTSQVSPVAQTTLLAVRDLRVEFETRRQRLEAVHGVSFDVRSGGTVAIVGESGSGKSVTARALLGLLGPRARVSGSACFDGLDLVSATRRQLRDIRGRRIAMIFQDALDALNPVHRVGAQISEAVRAHGGVSRAEARARAVDLMGLVEIPSPRQRYDDYPHQFSGGMRQRIMIAMALALEPDLLIADEPTTALDATVQAQILGLLATIRERSKTAIVLITHDLEVARDFADQIAVMYAGRLMETGAADALLCEPAHPYTAALIASSPQRSHRGGRLPVIPGVPPSIDGQPPGCPFHPRCQFTMPRCVEELPQAWPTSTGTARCHLREVTP
jgi:oligopeptide/dipeptide ABC transporter ATP-binding protein